MAIFCPVFMGAGNDDRNVTGHEHGVSAAHGRTMVVGSPDHQGVVAGQRPDGGVASDSVA